jgi:CRP-like cAMP-binding protein
MLDGAPPGGLGERLLALRGLPLLAALPAAELALVARLSRERDLQPGETLAVEGDSVQAVQLIVSGQVTLARDGRPVPGAGVLETVGLLPLAAGLPHPFTAVAADAVHALEIDAELVAEVLEDDFGLFARVLQLGAVAALAATARATRRDPAAEAGRPGAQRTTIAGSPGKALAPLDAAERLLVLRGNTWFRTVPLDSLAALAKRLELVQLRPDAELTAPRGPGDLLLLVAGRASTAAGELGPGAALGVLEGLADASSPIALRALTPVQLLRGSASDLFDVLEDHPAMGRALLAEMVRVIAG